MTTREEVYQAIRNADAAGDSESVRELSKYLKTLKPKQYQPRDTSADTSPTDGMSGLSRLLSGTGKAFTDLGRGAGQIARSVMPDKTADSLGLPTQESVDDARRYDAPLMNTGAGITGNIVGNVAAALPAMFVPGAQGLVGATVTGGAMGALQPTATGESRAKNTAMGAAVGGGSVLAGRAINATYKGAKALAEPLYPTGRQAIAGRTLNRFGVVADDVAGLSNQPTITGARPMMAEQITRPEGAAGAARLQDSLRSLDPETAVKFTGREMENNAARVGTLSDLAGDGGAYAAAQEARATTSRDLYGKAFNSPPQVSGVNPVGDAEMTALMQTPAIQDAMREAQLIARNKGLNIASPEGSVEGLHFMKMALDDAANSTGTGTAAQANKAASIRAARDRLTATMEKLSPEYATARTTHASMSKPLNQMDVAKELLKRGSSATPDLTGNARLMPDALARAAQDEGRLITQATGRKLPQGTLADLMEPKQLAKIQGVLGETNKLAAVGRAANGPGSATAQRMSSQNVLRQIMGPMGMPEKWAESTMLNTAMRPVQFMYDGVAEPRIQQTLAELMLDPTKAQAVLRAARTNPRTLSPAVREALPYLEQAVKTSIPAAAIAGQR